MKPCNVLIVDDSPTMRSIIAASLVGVDGVNVVGQASDAFEARDAIKRFNPDVVTLDIEMPRMNGLDFLERIMRLRPTPVVVVSSLTERGTETTIRALEIGAVDCVAKPNSQNPRSLDDLGMRLRAAAEVRFGGRSRSNSVASSSPPEAYASDGRVVAIGSSMGGVEALCALLQMFPEQCPPTVVTQHMPALFTQSFAKRLHRVCKANVREAEDGAQLAPGLIYLAPGGDTHLEISGTSSFRCRLRRGDLISGHRPSVDALFGSVARVAGAKSVGVILTGMGRDGAAGLLAMRNAGAETLGQDQATSLVYGMPKAAFELGAVGRQLPLSAIAPHVLRSTNALTAR